MFFRIFAFFAFLAVAFASPKPDPQVLTYAAAPGVLPVGYTGYSPLTYSASYSAPYAAVPYAYSGYYVR